MENINEKSPEYIEFLKTRIAPSVQPEVVEEKKENLLGRPKRQHAEYIKPPTDLLEYIENPDGEKTRCLGLYPYYATQFSKLRYNDCSVGEFEDMQIVGFKNLLSHSYGENPSPFLNMKKGAGMNPDCKIEGIHENNLFATYHTGPILPLNPQFTDYLIKLVDEGYVSVTLEYEKQAYDSRLKELLK